MLDGVLNVNKPAGVTSHDVVDFVRRLTGGAKTGHCGTLDPAATGVLLVCLGRATRLAEYLSAGRKAYRAVALLDRRTSTGDLEGDVTRRYEPGPQGLPDESRLEATLDAFRGTILQRPHRVSAVRVGGKRLYERAHAGQPIPDPPARPITIHRLHRVSWQFPRLDFEVDCSAGTYVRQLAEDLGEALGLGGCLESLVRTRSGRAGLEDARTPFELASLHARGALQEAVLSPAGLLDGFGEASVGPAGLERVSHGAALSRADLTGFREAQGQQLVKVLSDAAALVAIYRVAAADRLEPCKVLI